MKSFADIELPFLAALMLLLLHLCLVKVFGNCLAGNDLFPLSYLMLDLV